MKNFRYYKAIEEHTQWLESNKKYGKQLVLENEDLSYLSIVDTDLSESIFKNCNLERVAFENVTLDMAYFYENNFSYTNIIHSTLNNSIIKKNIFERVGFTDLYCKQTEFSKNNFNMATFNKINYHNSLFLSNSYIKCDYKNVNFENVELIEDSYDNSEFSNILYFSSLVESSKISNSYFYECVLRKSYINIEEINNIYLKCEPKLFLTKYRNEYNHLYLDKLFETLQNRFDRLEISPSNYNHISYEDYNFMKQRTELSDIYILLEKLEYQIKNNDAENKVYINKLKSFKEMALSIEHLMGRRVSMLNNIEKSGAESE